MRNKKRKNIRFIKNMLSTSRFTREWGTFSHNYLEIYLSVVTTTWCYNSIIYLFFNASTVGQQINFTYELTLALSVITLINLRSLQRPLVTFFSLFLTPRKVLCPILQGIKAKVFPPRSNENRSIRCLN